MPPDELQSWLEEPQSESSGWRDGSGETVGHERYSALIPYLVKRRRLIRGSSGRKIVDILSQNPTHDPSGYSDQDLEHMRRVVSYCKRHLAQEGGAKMDTGSRSYRSLKNWGHNALKETS